jgi:hypothetical protein
MELYEARVASLERFVAMCVLFHRMGSCVEGFFSGNSFGMLGYKINRTHSILKIATTASPVSADTLGDQMEFLRVRAKFQSAVHLIASAWHRKQQGFMRELKKRHSTPIRVAGDRKLSLDVSSALSALHNLDQSAKQGGMLLEDDHMTKTKIP